jgi:uncharacterized protein YndB with AHSA1/START domain
MKHPVIKAFAFLSLLVVALMAVGLFTSGETRIVRTAILNGTPDRVWPFFADLRGWPVWYRGDDGSRMTMSELIQGTTSNIDAERHAEDSWGYSWEEKVTGFEPEKRLELTGTNTGRRQNWRQEIKLEPQGKDNTKVTWVIEYTVSGPLMKLANKAQAEEQIANFMTGGLTSINPLIPSAEEWGGSPANAAPVAGAAPAGAAPADATTPGAAPAAAPAGDAAAATDPAAAPGAAPAAGDAAPAPAGK